MGLRKNARLRRQGQLVKKDEGGAVERRNFLKLGAAFAAMPIAGRSAIALDYPMRPVQVIVGQGGKLLRYYRAAHLSVSFPASRPAVRRRGSAGCDRQHRHRAGRARSAGWLHAASGKFAEYDQRRVIS